MPFAGAALTRPLVDVFALSTGDYGFPGRLFDVSDFAGLTAGDIVFRIVNDQQHAGPLVGTVVLNFLDIAEIRLAASATLRLGVLLPQPRGDEMSRALQLMIGAVGGP